MIGQHTRDVLRPFIAQANAQNMLVLSVIFFLGKDEVTGSNPVISSNWTCRNASPFVISRGKNESFTPRVRHFDDLAGFFAPFCHIFCHIPR